ncbi:MAG TPA: 23S rRNA (adenine(2030)-N(6))-methyltransferase RlmJ [Pseudomonadales bacterium]
MLSYRHAFHAGNFADVLKHLVLVNVLQYAMRKDAPLFYVDTHAGAGLYGLNADAARKTGEAADGIGRLDFAALQAQAGADGRDALQAYHAAVGPFLARTKYPGSPLVAAALLRRQDHLRLFELHSTDFRLLLENVEHDRRIHCEQEDGFKALPALLPPVQKRAVVLIDPSFEVKDDYARSVRALVNVYERMPSAQVLLWYPVVQRAQVDWMVTTLLKSPLRDLWQVELGVQPDTEAHGMTASGLILLNPPWTLAAQLNEALPLLQQQLAPGTGHWFVKNLVAE